MEENQSQSGVITEAAVQPDLSSQQSMQQTTQEQYVPLSALQAERRERQQLQENVKLMQDHMVLMQANLQQPAQSQPKEEFQGLSDNDVLTVGEAKKFINQFSRQQRLEVEELKISQQFPDYNEVVRKYLPDVLKNDPDLKEAIMSAPNPYKMAYHLAKRSDGYLNEQREQPRSQQAQQVIQNLARPGNLSSIGSAVSSGSIADHYKSMSDDAFTQLANKNRGYA